MRKIFEIIFNLQRIEIFFNLNYFQILHAREAVVAALAPHGKNPAKGAVVGNARGQQQGKDVNKF